MNDTKSIITSIILGYAIFALFFITGFIVLMISLRGFDILMPIHIYPALITISNSCFIVAILGTLIACYGITGLPKYRNNKLTKAAKLLIGAAICSAVSTTAYILAINGFVNGFVIAPIIISPLILNAILNTDGYDALFEGNISNKRQATAKRWLICANWTYIASLVSVIITIITLIFNISGIAFCIFAALYLAHWVLFFVGWSKVRASFGADTSDSQ